VSDDGRITLVLIALLGNPFSPEYARARARGGENPLECCALHVALYVGREHYWSLAERAVEARDRSATLLGLGRSRLAWTHGALVIDIDERTTGTWPQASRGAAIRGRVTVHPRVWSRTSFELDRAGQHCWYPVAPAAHVEVDLDQPDVRFRAHGYVDANAGSTPIESTFARWSWSRARLPRLVSGAGETAAVTYDVQERGTHDEATETLIFRRDGWTAAPGIRRAPLPRTRWGLSRAVGADEGWGVRLARSLEDGPCYARALVSTRILGEDVTAVHEVLSGERLGRPWVRYLLGFRVGEAR
jgi:carotenoid 1,2-hydratase